MNPTHNSIQLSPMSYLDLNIGNGIKYALWFMAISMLCGAVYGILAGIVVQPGIYLIIYTGAMVMINFIVALCLAVPNFLFMLFKSGTRRLLRYFGLSSGFAIVYFVFFVILHLLDLQIF